MSCVAPAVHELQVHWTDSAIAGLIETTWIASYLALGAIGLLPSCKTGDSYQEFHGVAVQDGVEVPIVLENIGCSGNETRLVECPVEERIVPTQFYSIDYDFDYYTRQAAYCDLDYTPAPYAYVACGTITGQGVSLFCG